MSNEMKKAQEEMEKLMKEHMKDVYGENFENMGDLMKQAFENSLSNLEKEIDIEAIQNVAPGVDMATILQKTQEAKEEALQRGNDAIVSQSEAITKAMNEMFSSGNTGLQDMISEQMKQFQAMTGIEDFTKMTPEDMQNYYESQMNMWNGLENGEEEDVSLEGVGSLIENMYNSLPDGNKIKVKNGDEYIEKFEILLSGILSYINGHENDTLDVEEHDDFFNEKINYILTEFWGIESKEDVYDTIGWLLNEGHTDEYLSYVNANTIDELITEDMDEEEVEIVKNGFEFAKYFKDKLPENIMLGWDYGRASAIVRWAYFMNYINEEEAWEILDKIAGVMIGTFNSWKEFGISYIVGGLFWTYRKDPSETYNRYYETVEALEGLLTETDDEDDGEWLRNPWIKEVL